MEDFFCSFCKTWTYRCQHMAARCSEAVRNPASSSLPPTPGAETKLCRCGRPYWHPGECYPRMTPAGADGKVSPHWWRRLNQLEGRLQALAEQVQYLTPPGQAGRPTTEEEPPGEMPSIITRDGLVVLFTWTPTGTICMTLETRRSPPLAPTVPGDAEIASSSADP